jgi:hypothetical protein
MSEEQHGWVELREFEEGWMVVHAGAECSDGAVEC